MLPYWNKFIILCWPPPPSFAQILQGARRLDEDCILMENKETLFFFAFLNII